MIAHKIIRLLSRFDNLVWLIALIMGFIYISIVPPFQVPDSPNHFFRTYQLATGNISPLSENSSVGGYVPESFHLFQETFTPFRYNPYHKMEKSVLDSAKKIELNQEKKVFMHFPNTAVYSPVSYIPQVIGMRLGLWFQLNPYSLFYFIKCVSFLCWMSMMRVVFYFLPIKKKLFAVLLLLPMSLFINSSFSADMMSNGLSWMFLAVVLNLALRKVFVSNKKKIFLIVLVVLLGLAKLVYIPLVLLLFLIPFSSFGSKVKKGVFIGLSLLMGFGAASTWKSHIDSFYTSYLDYNEQHRDHVTLGYQADMNLQKEFIQENKLFVVGVFASSYVREFGDMMTGYIGNLGWNRFRMPYWFIFCAYGVILFFAIGDTGETYYLSIKQKLLLLFVVGITTILVMLSQYLTWNPVGNDKLWPLMGRYFTPVYPLLFLVFSSKRMVVPKWNTLVFVLYAILVTGYTAQKMSDSFYSTKPLKEVWRKDFSSTNTKANGIEQKFEFGVINGNTNPILTTDSTNAIGIELSAESPFGFPVTLKSLKKGDKIMVAGWRSNENIQFVFDDKPFSNYYTATCHSTKKRKDGFEFVKETYFCQEDFEELKVYLYYTGQETGVFNNYSISYYQTQ